MASTEAGIVGSGFEISRILEEQRRQDEKRRVKRAANRKSASTSRARKKAFVDDMTAKNERMKQHAFILSMLPDLVLAVCRSGEMTYVSPACQWLLQHSPEEITGANVFEMVTHDCHALLRKMISDNLSRPVHSKTSAADLVERDGSDDDADLSDDEECTPDRSACREKVANHQKERHQHQQYRQQSSSATSSMEGPRAKAVQVASPASQGPKMLKLIRRDKTTVWCESRLSVRTAKRDGGAAPIPLEIILTLRTMPEGTKPTMAHEFVGARVPAIENVSLPSERAVDADNYVEADDDGYQCEVDEEDSNNSGSGNDSGTTRNGHIAVSTSGSIGCGGGSNKKRAEVEPDTEPVSDPMEGREERSLSKKRQRVRISNRMEDMLSAASGGGSDKSGGDNGFSRGADTAGSTTGSTTQESSASGSNEVDSNGEGSNNGSSKWGDGCGGAARFNSISPCGGSEDGGSSDGTSAEGTDFGDEVQSAVQSLILMGGDFSKGAE